jgi:hypothetical protein
MKVKKSFIALVCGIALSGLFFAGCNKDNKEADQNEEILTVQDNANAEKTFNDVSDIADQAYNSFQATKSTTTDGDIIGECAVVSLDTITFPRTLTIDFGDTNCLCADGRYRRGKILVSFTSHYREEGTVITHTFDNYFVNNNQVLGTKIVTNAGRNENDHLYFTITVDGLIIKADGGGQVTWVSSRIREWILGEETFDRFDDVYLITGNGSGTMASGKSYTIEITNSLRREIGCKHFVSGTFEFKPEDKPLRVFDYGEGECDNVATVTVNGKTYTIYLH